MKKVFIDCGAHHGEGLRYFIPRLGIDYNWEVHCFEPNTACLIYDRIEEIERQYKVMVQPSVRAVWTCDALLDFKQENHFISQSGSPTDGRSKLDGWASQVAELNGDFRGLESTIKVVGFNFSEFLLQFAYGYDVYCKMDIEGSEFPVLRKVLNDGRAGILKHLWVEFHERFLPAETAETKWQLIRELSKHTVVTEWH